MRDVMAALFGHNGWANGRLLEACRGLSEEQLAADVAGTFGRLDATLQHLCAAEAWYVQLLSGEVNPGRLRESDPFPGVAALIESSRTSGEALQALAELAEPGMLLRVEEDGEAYVIPFALPLLQAINHATEHRAHVMTILSQLGVPFPEIDGWAYGDQVMRPA